MVYLRLLLAALSEFFGLTNLLRDKESERVGEIKQQNSDLLAEITEEKNLSQAQMDAPKMVKEEEEWLRAGKL